MTREYSEKIRLLLCRSRRTDRSDALPLSYCSLLGARPQLDSCHNCCIILTKAFRHCYATCLAASHRDKLHETLNYVTNLATAKNSVAREVADTVEESIIEFYFPQRFTQPCNEFCVSILILVLQRFAAPANENVPLTSCDHRKRSKLREALHSVTPIKQLVS